MVNINDATEVVPYLSSAATIVMIQKWLKTNNIYNKLITAFPGADKYAHWFFAGLMSLAAAAGIHYVWSGSLNDFLTGKGGLLTITVPSLMDMFHGTSDWWKVYVFQHAIYESQVAKAVIVTAQESNEKKLNPSPAVVSVVK